MIVGGPEGFRKNQYRKFNIRTAELAPGDDYGMMREVLRRRFRRLLAEAPIPSPHTPAASPLEGKPEPAGPAREGGISANLEAISLPIPPPQRGREAVAGAQQQTASIEYAENESGESPWPDLVLIDGGLGQLNAARDTLDELGLRDLAVIAIAKGPERDAGRESFFMAGREPFRLKPRDPVLYFVERLRDEAHRFAVGSHRQRRKRGIREAGLQEIPGIGPARKRALLRHFGTLKAIERASVADLEQVPGINAETARKVYDFLH
jgi:excinuclease ABC subunit C